MDNNLNNNGANNNQQYQQYQAPYQQQYQQPYQPELEEPVSIGDWVGSLLLFNLVPCIGLIVCIVWAFSKDTKKSKANFCKAYLIIYLISIVFCVVAFLVLGATIGGLVSDLTRLSYYY